ncbi:MAG: type IV secretory system conjugative DNA transfer family protein, partial [Ktedonobacteraceae bacterium]|nr:type IV secretory system conjugative DNA transfer family protein [Ktedonobacteraceae bacterium]
MRWTRLLLLVLLLCLTLCCCIIFYPAYQAASTSPSHDALAVFILNGFTTAPKQMQGPLPWVMFVLLALFVLMVDLDIRLKKRYTHGSAHHATWRDARPFVQARPSFPRLPSMSRALQVFSARPPSPSRLLLGTYQGKTIALSEQQQESNILLTAPIGAGKTSRMIIPNLLEEQGNRSLFIADVKNELLRTTAGAVRQHHTVWVVSPTHPERSKGYNPLALIHNIEDAQEFARCWVSNTGKSEEDFWPNAAIQLMTATLMHLRSAEPDAPFSRVADILCHMPYSAMKDTLLNSPSSRARKEITAFFDYMDMNPKLIGSLMVDTGTRFQLLESDQIKALTHTNQIDFRAMTEHPTALYLSIPRRYAQRYQPLLACFMMQMFATWEEI